jgi:hypothetical protein
MGLYYSLCGGTVNNGGPAEVTTERNKTFQNIFCFRENIRVLTGD